MAELDGRLESFIRLRQAKLLWPRDHEHDFASWAMCLIMSQQFGSGAATEFLEFLCQFACNAKLALWHGVEASGKRFHQPIRRFKKYCSFFAVSRFTQFTLASAAFHRKKSTERKFLSRKSGPEQSGQDRRRPGNDRERQFAIDGVPASVISAMLSPRARRSVSSAVRAASLCSW